MVKKCCLQDLKEFCGSFDSGMKGLTLSNSDQIRSVHNSFARQTLFEFDSKKVQNFVLNFLNKIYQAEKDDDVFHFVSFLPINGRIYELDGLKVKERIKIVTISKNAGWSDRPWACWS